MAIADVVGHHNGIVDDQIQRNGNPCQGIELHFQPKGIIENESDGNVYRQAGYNQKEITQVPSDQRHKYQ